MRELSKHVRSNLCSLSRACLSNQHEALMTVEDIVKAFFIFPNGQLQPLLEDLVVAWGVRQVSERVDLLLHGRLLQRNHAYTAGHTGAEGRTRTLAVPLSVPVTISVAVAVTIL